MSTTLPLPPLGALLTRAAGTLARGRRPWPAAGLPPPSFEAASLEAEGLRAFFGGLLGPAPLPVLYGYAQRAQLAAMTGAAFPYRVPGLIHLANAQRLLQAPAAGPFRLEVRTALDVTPEREVVVFEVDFIQEEVFATCKSEYLARKLASHRSEPEAAEELPHQESWHLPADEGRRYAAVSGDYNPVHLSPWLARLFGYPRPLAHGMDTAGRVVAALERAGGRPVTALEVAFKRPILLPARVRLAWDETGRYRVVSHDGAILHATGIGSA